MPPGGAGGGEHGCAAQDHPPAPDRRDEGATPPIPAVALLASEEKEQQQEHQQERQHPTASLPEGPLVEILARVPYRSLCRFKCVCKAWLALCSSRDICKRSPQTLSGFFYTDISGLHFRNLSGRGPPLVDPSLSFLRESHTDVFVEQFGDGLLLCRCWNMGTEIDYIVCNPATEEWTVLPPLVLPAQVFGHLLHFRPIAYLGFDVAVPSRFVVFAPLTNGLNDSGKVAIYSSETGQWIYVQSKWAAGTLVYRSRKTHVFLNGTMHLTTLHKSIVTIDTEGKVWREIKMPDDLPSCSGLPSIGQSQGRLFMWQVDNDNDRQLYVWVLEDYAGANWTLKHTVNVSELFGRQRGEDDMSYKGFALHPDCNLIFIADDEETAVSYDMDNQQVHVICTDPEFQDVLPYTPCFAEWSSDDDDGDCSSDDDDGDWYSDDDDGDCSSDDH